MKIGKKEYDFKDTNYFVGDKAKAHQINIEKPKFKEQRFKKAKF